MLERFKQYLTIRNIIITLVALLVLSLSGMVYFYRQATADPQKEAIKELNSLVSSIGVLMILPNETPTLATVSDPEKLRDQPFFTNAKKDDKVLIYTNAKKAILYRPSINKIIEVAPINTGNQVQSPSGTPIPLQQSR